MLAGSHALNSQLLKLEEGKDKYDDDPLVGHKLPNLERM